MKIGLDLHGVIDTNKEFFSDFTNLFVREGHEVHILTGPQAYKVIPQLKKMKIYYTHLFSITDWALNSGYDVVMDKNNNPTIEPYVWDKAKAEYATKHSLDMHLDDSDVYGYFFKTPYARFFSKNTHRVRKIKI